MAPPFGWKPYTQTYHRSVYPAIDPTTKANSVAGKVIVVSGGGTGIGKSIAQAFVTAGASTVAILGRRLKVLQKTRIELEASEKTKILAYAVDVLDGQALQEAFTTISREAGPIDVVIANAGYFSTPALVTSTDISDWWRGFEVNIKGTAESFRAFHPHRASQSAFISVNSSIVNYESAPMSSAYQISKVGLVALICTLQKENPDVRVASFHPGVLPTDMSIKCGVPFTDDDFDDMSLPSSFAVWLCSPSANFIGGKMLWAHWDVEELRGMKDRISKSDELTFALKGWPKGLSHTDD